MKYKIKKEDFINKLKELPKKGEQGPIGPKGPKGDKGDKGDQGERGPKGPRGEIGLKGEKGDKGETGEIGKIGPKGDQGLKGDKGDKGERGEAGKIGQRGFPADNFWQEEDGNITPKNSDDNLIIGGNISAKSLTVNNNQLIVDPVSGNVGIGINSPAEKLEVNGNIRLTANGGQMITTPGKELVLEQTGDVYGIARLRLRNRSGSNGAIFEDPSLDLVDFGFLPSSGVQSNLRLEHRSSKVLSGNGDGEFQLIGPSGTWAMWFRSGRGKTVIASGDVGIGTTTPNYKTHIVGTLGVNPGSSVTPVNNGDVVVELTDDATLKFKAKGSDGTIRSGVVSLS